jgi:hypothetical protein
MPRNISTSKKYLPARSNALSPSSHFLGGGNRKPGGGGPAGVAARAKVVEKRATVAGEGKRPAAKAEGRSSVGAKRVRASMVNGRVLAIVCVGWSRRWGLSRCKVAMKLELDAERTNVRIIGGS